MDEDALVVENLRKTFPVRRSLRDRIQRVSARQLVAVDGVSIAVEPGRVLGIVGESGCGKTTLARCIVRLLEPDEGTIRLGDIDLATLSQRELRRLRSRVQMVFQDPYTSLTPRLRVGEAIGEAALVHGMATKETVTEYVNELLELVGLSQSLASRRPRELSGGQRQRVAIARALAVKPSVLIADEAVSALDVSIQAQILNLLRRLTEELDLATVFIAHQLAVIAHLCDSVAVMYLGKVVESGPTVDIFASPQHPYTAALLAAHPEPVAKRRERRDAITGDLPSPLDIPSGCRFRTRCPHAESRCLVEPAVIQVSPAHEVRCVVMPFSSSETSH